MAPGLAERAKHLQAQRPVPRRMMGWVADQGLRQRRNHKLGAPHTCRGAGRGPEDPELPRLGNGQQNLTLREVGSFRREERCSAEAFKRIAAAERTVGLRSCVRSFTARNVQANIGLTGGEGVESEAGSRSQAEPC